MFPAPSDVSKYYNETTKVITMPEVEFEDIPGGLGTTMFKQMKLHLDKVAQIDGVTGETDTYSTFLTKCIRTAIEMKKYAVTPNDVISICSYNDLNCSIPLIAAILMGVKVASLDPTLSHSDVVHLINLVKPKMIFANEESEKLIENAIKECQIDTKIVLFGQTERNLMFADFILAKENEEDFVPYYESDLGEVAIIVFSSGTTGLPKGICWNHRMILQLCAPQYLSVSLGFASLYWSSTIFNTVNAALSGSIKAVCPPFTPKICWDAIDIAKVSFLCLSPSDAIQFYRNRPADVIKETTLKALFILGGSLSDDYVQKLRKLLPKSLVLNCYAQTEMIGVFSTFNELSMSKADTVGIPVLGKTYKVVDTETEETCGFNQRGELRVKTKWCMSGYYKQDSASAWDEDGFLKTGDVMYYDEDFCFYVVDRIKEMFKYKSWHIVPAKIESILMGHPDVKYNVIVGIPHEEDDNHISAVVQINEGSKITAEEIQKFVDERVDDRHKLRAGVKFIDEMPFTPSQKIMRKKVRDMFSK